MYLSNSSISKKFSTKGELMYKADKTPYEGNYILTNKGKMYASWDNTSTGPELLYTKLKNQDLQQTEQNEYSKYISSNIHSKIYQNKKQGVRNFLFNIIPVPSAKQKPTIPDYMKGYYKRYFVKRINSFKYLEIDKKVYNSIISKMGKYDHNLYDVGSIDWNITGINIYKNNSLAIKKLNTKFPNIFYLFPVLNEFFKAESEILENQITEGGELYYGDSTEYIGSYHIHPLKGPMVGAEHSSTSHAKLYYSSQLPNKNSFNIFDLVKSTTSKPGLDKPTISTNDRIVRSPSTPPPPPSIPSSGGGGGY